MYPSRTVQPTIELTDSAREVLSDLRQDNPAIHVLVDDTGCCGSSHVFVQDHPPGPRYEAVGTAEGVDVHLHPGFQRGTTLEELSIDVTESRADDSFSLETRLGVRLTLAL